MAELNVKETRRARKIRLRGRGSQVPIYLGKQLRFFVLERSQAQPQWRCYPKDWWKTNTDHERKTVFDVFCSVRGW